MVYKFPSLLKKQKLMSYIIILFNAKYKMYKIRDRINEVDIG